MNNLHIYYHTKKILTWWIDFDIILMYGLVLLATVEKEMHGDIVYYCCAFMGRAVSIVAFVIINMLAFQFK